MDILLVCLGIILLTVGLLGTIHPAIPGLPLMFGGVWALAYQSDYLILGSGTLWAVGIITAFGMALDFVAGLAGAKATGASKKALWGAFIGGVLGIFFGIFGMILGPLIGAAIGEFMDKQSLLTAGKVGMGTFIGFIIGVMAKIGCGLAILAIVCGNYLFALFS
ncbi:DUF456 domain-containing protein [Neisseriaceae bacterium CLB008]|nr:DUF456 family protein [Neisseriaceae bacterium]